MEELLALYGFFFKLQFVNPSFYLWLTSGFVMGWPNKFKVLGFLAVSIVFMPVFIIALKWIETF